MITFNGHPVPAQFAGLTQTQLEVLSRASAHHPVDRISADLNIAPSTVGAHLDAAARSVGGTRPEAKHAAVRHGLVHDGAVLLDPTCPRVDHRTVITTDRDNSHDPALHQELGAFFTLRGYEADEVTGIYFTDAGRRLTETGWQGYGVPDGFAIALGLTYGQEAVLANGAMYHLRRPANPGRIWASHADYIQNLDSELLDTFRSPHTRLADDTGWTAVFTSSEQLTYWPSAA
ncbi:MAG: helix-turn-helix transcriptional regulator [Acidimicrobiales bacterium]